MMFQALRSTSNACGSEQMTSGIQRIPGCSPGSTTACDMSKQCCTISASHRLDSSLVMNTHWTPLAACTGVHGSGAMQKQILSSPHVHGRQAAPCNSRLAAAAHLVVLGPGIALHCLAGAGTGTHSSLPCAERPVAAAQAAGQRGAGQRCQQLLRLLPLPDVHWWRGGTLVPRRHMCKLQQGV